MDPWDLTEVSRKVFLEKMNYALLVNEQLRVKESGQEGSGAFQVEGSVWWVQSALQGQFWLGIEWKGRK